MVKEDKYELIINSAIELLQTENYQNMKTATIAKGAGIAEGTIYRYFKNKKEIFEEVLKYALIKLEEIAFNGITSEKNFEENFEILKNNFMTIKERGKKYYKIKYKAYSEMEEEEIKKIVLENSDKERENMQNIFKWAVEKKEIEVTEEKIETIVYMLLAFSQYSMRLYTIGHPQSEIEKELKNVIEYMNILIK